MVNVERETRGPAPVKGGGGASARSYHASDDPPFTLAGADPPPRPPGARNGVAIHFDRRTLSQGDDDSRRCARAVPQVHPAPLRGGDDVPRLGWGRRRRLGGVDDTLVRRGRWRWAGRRECRGRPCSSRPSCPLRARCSALGDRRRPFQRTIDRRRRTGTAQHDGDERDSLTAAHDCSSLASSADQRSSTVGPGLHLSRSGPPVNPDTRYYLAEQTDARGRTTTTTILRSRRRADAD